MGSLRRSDDTGLTLYVILRDASHQVVIQATGAVEAYNSANWGTYDHAATEQGASGYYYATISDDLPAGIYWIEWKYQSGASPAVSDTVRASGSAYWSGTAWWTATVDVGTIKTVDADTAISTRVDASTLATDLNNMRDMSKNAITAGTINDAMATTLSFVTNLTEATNDHYKNRILEFTSGALLGQGREITDYDGGTKTITVNESFTEAPTNGSTFKILGYISP
jgi:hypothetical protein